MSQNLPYCQIYMIRHGETEWNVKGRIQGHSDIPLNEMGEKQALELQQNLASIPFTAAFSSDLSRARKTAEIILHPRNLSVNDSPALRERSAGMFEGRPFHEMDEWMKPRLPLIVDLPREEYLSYEFHPEIETLSNVYKRVTNFLFTYIPSHLGNNLLVVSHGGVLRSLLDHFMFDPKKRWVIGNGGYLKIKATPSQFELESYIGIVAKEIN